MTLPRAGLLVFYVILCRYSWGGYRGNQTSSALTRAEIELDMTCKLSFELNAKTPKTSEKPHFYEPSVSSAFSPITSRV
jgi:hypothetical protein